MANKLKNDQFFVAFTTLLLMPTSWAQRPSFAGSRPPNGLNQKDKYHSTTIPNIDIENRFGSAITNQIPFGQPQKPPIGYPVVLPEPLYTALASPAPIPANNMGASVIFEDRFGDTGNNTIMSPTTTSATQQPGVPLDAHGDQLLIDHLNQIPIDKRPFWFINYQAIEAQRNGTATNFAGAQGSRELRKMATISKSAYHIF